MRKDDLRAMVEKIWGPVPLVVGEDASAYDTLLEAVIDEWRPAKPRQWMLVRSVTNYYWECRRYDLYHAAIVNELIAEGIASEIAAKLPGNDFVETTTKLWRTPRRLPSSIYSTFCDLATNEIVTNRQKERAWRQMAFMAVGGDHDAAMRIEANIGAVRIGLDAKWGYQAILPALLLVQRLKTAAETNLARALAELERLQRSTGRKLARPALDEPHAPAQNAIDDEVSVRAPHETRKPEQS